MGTEDTSRRTPQVTYLYAGLTQEIIGAALEVHKELGNGFLEKVYENALQIELKRRDLSFSPQVPIPVAYKGQPVGTYYADLIVADLVLCEIKALDALAGVHESQVLHYLKATGLRLGLLLNFGSAKLQVRRLIL